MNILLLGGIGSGKSEALKILKEVIYFTMIKTNYAK